MRVRAALIAGTAAALALVGLPAQATVTNTVTLLPGSAYATNVYSDTACTLNHRVQQVGASMTGVRSYRLATTSQYRQVDVGAVTAWKPVGVNVCATLNYGTPDKAEVVTYPKPSTAPQGPVTSSGVTWNQTFAENFTGTTRPAVWHPYSDTLCCDNKYNDAQRVTYHDGLMDVALTNVNGVLEGTGGIFGSPSSTGMRTAVRFRTDKPFTGAGEANMLWPSSDVWGDGEVDWPETQFDSTIQGYIHQLGANPGANAESVDTGITPSSGWHTAVTEWLPGGFVKAYLDGRLVMQTTTTAEVPSTAHQWAFQAADNGGADSAGGHFLIDWAAAWTPAG